MLVPLVADTGRILYPAGAYSSTISCVSVFASSILFSMIIGMIPNISHVISSLSSRSISGLGDEADTTMSSLSMLATGGRTSSLFLG